MPSAGLAWCVYENGVDFLKLNIKHRVLLWGLFASLLTFLLAGAIYFYSMSDTKDAFAKQGAALGDDVAESVGQISGQDAKERLLASAVLKARHIDRELVLIGEDAEYMADRMSMLLTSPNRYPPRTLQSTRDSASITSGTPYIHFSPTLSNAQIESDLAEEIETAGNIADTLSLMSRSYSGYRSCFFVVSRKGYSIYLDITADGKGNVLPDGAAREDMLSDTLKNDYELKIGDFEVEEKTYYARYKLPITIKNKSDYKIKFYVKIKAVDADGKTLGTDYFYSDQLKPGASDDGELFDYGYSSTYEKLKDAKFEIVEVSERSVE